MAEGLTDRQKQILAYLLEYKKQFGFPPSFQEIADKFKFASLTAVKDHLKALEKKGFIKKSGFKARAIDIIIPEEEMETFSPGIPIIGKVAAGSPILAQENIQGYLNFGNYFADNGNVFALKVQGDSMKDDGILDGDVVIIKHQATAINGDIVVAIIDEEATVKTFYNEGDRIRLQPQNPKYQAIYVDDSQSFRIGGKVIGVVRKLGAGYSNRAS
ncbi:MAG: transcriptional repressor LexA [Bacteroidetes bacterium]|nr:transcriptional repressor LexA [Bacteroidota bacterium]